MFSHLNFSRQRFRKCVAVKNALKCKLKIVFVSRSFAKVWKSMKHFQTFGFVCRFLTFEKISKWFVFCFEMRLDLKIFKNNYGERENVKKVWKNSEIEEKMAVPLKGAIYFITNFLDGSKRSPLDIIVGNIG